MKSTLVRLPVILLLLPLSILFACKKEGTLPPDPPPSTGTVSIRFIHRVDSVPLVLDTFSYTTMGGVLFKVTDLQYFVSAITLHLHGGGSIVLSDGDSIRYVDARLPETQEWSAAGEIPAAAYDAVSFTFGLNDHQNISKRFPNPPERDMFWPEVLGGGYHHMKLNSMWKNSPTGLESPFMMHLGTGQIYSSQTPNTDSIVGFVQNWFHVTLPQSSFTLEKDSTRLLNIVMHIDHLFNGPPNMLDLPNLPQGIMQDQTLMQVIKENGQAAFSIDNSSFFLPH